MENLLDLTIIIPSYNTRRLLRDCLSSIYEHTRGITFEVICIDDHSPDGSADMVAQDFPQVTRFANRYYATRFDYSKAQPVDSIGTTAYMLRRSTWESAGMLDERFRLFVSDLAYNFMLQQKGYRVDYTPCAEIVHFGSQSVNQKGERSLRELHEALVTFNEAYDYFGKSRASKLMVRWAVGARGLLKRAEYHLSSDKRVIKGPGAPPRTRPSPS